MLQRIAIVRFMSLLSRDESCNLEMKFKLTSLTQPLPGGDVKEVKWLCIVLNGFVSLLGFSRSAGIIGGSVLILWSMNVDRSLFVGCLSLSLGVVSQEDLCFRTIIGVRMGVFCSRVM